MKAKIVGVLTLIACLWSAVYAQTENSSSFTVAFYNVENLFDTLNDASSTDDDFHPKGIYGWNKKRYDEKIDNIAEVISKIENGPDIIGLSEIENANVLNDLLASEQLMSKNYAVVHSTPPVTKVINVALLYNKKVFKPLLNISLINSVDRDEPSGSILWVKGMYMTEVIHIFVNHWPGQNEAKEAVRSQSAKLVQHTIDSVQQIEPESKFIILGDFGDDPISKSLKKGMKAGFNKLGKNELYNTSYSSFKNGQGSVNNQDRWHLFDQIIISQSLMKNKSKTYYYDEQSFYIFAPDWLKISGGNKVGTPFRTYSDGIYHGGYSDHFPVYITLKKH